MKILFIGDIIGKPGRRAVSELLPGIINNHGIELVIANCENAAGGFGITRDIVEELYKNSVDVLTSGNHIWDKKEIYEFIEDYETLLRPVNYPEGCPGWGNVLTKSASGMPIGIINLEGRVFMKPVECPFRTADKELNKIKNITNIIIIDIHAEATSEKQALGWYLDGKVSAIVGSHTHVQTADERILPNGTAYITDAGMTGPFDSVIGIRKDIAIKRFLTLTPSKYYVAKKNVRLQGVILDIDNESGKSISIERLNIKLEE